MIDCRMKNTMKDMKDSVPKSIFRGYRLSIAKLPNMVIFSQLAYAKY